MTYTKDLALITGRKLTFRRRSLSYRRWVALSFYRALISKLLSRRESTLLMLYISYVLFCAGVTSLRSHSRSHQAALMLSFNQINDSRFR